MFWQFRLEMRLFGDIFKQCVFHATNLSRRTIRCLRHIHKFWSSNFSSRENAKVNKLCPTAYYQSRAAAKLDFHFLLTLAAAWTNKANIVAADNIGILCKKNVGDSGILLCPFSSLRLYISFCFAESEIAFLSRLQIAILVSWVEFHVFWKCCWFRSFQFEPYLVPKIGSKMNAKKNIFNLPSRRTLTGFTILLVKKFF